MNFDIDKIKRKLLIKYPGFATIIANMKFIEDDSCISNGTPTAGTEGENFIYHPEFMNKMSEGQQLFIVAHEVSHIALNHIKRSEGKDPSTWNFATDAVINGFLVKDGLEMVEGGIFLEDATNYDAESLYEKLLKKKDKGNSLNNNQENNSNQHNQQSNNKNNSNNQSDNKGNSNNSSSEQHNESSSDNQQQENNTSITDVGHDTHSMWEESLDKDKGKEFHDSDIQKEQKQNSKQGEKKTFKKNQNLRKENLKKLRDALAKQSSGYGEQTSSKNMKIQDIGEADSLINWQTILRNIINSKIDWSYKNATIEDGVVTPHLEDLSNLETEILLDTSGSVSVELLRNFLRECKKIIGYSSIKVGCFDTQFYGFNDIKKESDIDNMPIIGRGGTNFTTAVNSFTPKATNRIIFTDGEAPMPDISKDIIWVVYGNTKINPIGGKVVYITNEQLRRMMYIDENNISIKKK